MLDMSFGELNNSRARSVSFTEYLINVDILTIDLFQTLQNSYSMHFLDIEGIPKGAAVAQLQTIRFSDLLDRSEHEMDNLMSACEHYGFFYLDLTCRESANMFQDLDDLRLLMGDWFKQPLVSKLKTPTISNAHGYGYKRIT